MFEVNGSTFKKCIFNNTKIREVWAKSLSTPSVPAVKVWARELYLVPNTSNTLWTFLTQNGDSSVPITKVGVDTYTGSPMKFYNHGSDIVTSANGAGWSLSTMYFTEPVDVTNYSKLTVTLDVTRVSVGYPDHYPRIGISQTKPTSHINVSFKDGTSNYVAVGQHTLEIDLSQKTGLYYICIYIGTCDMTTTSVMLT